VTETVTRVDDLVTLGALRSPRRIAVKDRAGHALGYAELNRRCTRLAAALRARGLAPGDRVAAWLEDSVAYVELYLAVARAGLVLVPINARFRLAEAEHIMVDSGARALVWSDGVAVEARLLAERCEPALTVSIARDRFAAWTFEGLVEAGGPTPTDGPRDPDALYVIGYTSGTTGRPKGAMLTHRSVLAICRLNAHSYRLPAFGVAALTGSMSFVATVPAHILSHLYVGGTVVIMGRYDIPELIETIEREQVTFTYVPSPLLAEFTAAAAAAPTRWRTLQSLLHSASSVEPDALRALAAVVGDRLVEGLGMTENSGGLVTATTRADVTGTTDADDVFASVGRPVVETLVELRDDEGRPLPHDGETVGELVVCSPALMSGYWGRPEETARALRDGWWFSGDLGTIDAAGYVYVRVRRTDLIVSGGMNVYPGEVERCIATLAGVRECAVVGVPHERWGQTVVAAVVGDVREAEVVERCREQLASYKKPTAVVLLDELPRTTSLKVARARVRELVLDRLSGSGSGSGSAVGARAATTHRRGDR
jgi:acyl-CoA synthetase (AMP-forming)/AMP-acid ligase II